MSMRTHFICMLFRIHQFECIIFLKETLKFHAHENKWLHCKQNTDEKLISVNSLSTKKTVTTFKQEIKRQFFFFRSKLQSAWSVWTLVSKENCETCEILTTQIRTQKQAARLIHDLRTVTLHAYSVIWPIFIVQRISNLTSVIYDTSRLCTLRYCFISS